MDLKDFYTWASKSTSNTSIVVFRIVFSFFLLIQTFYFIDGGFIDKNIIKPLILFPFVNGVYPMSKPILMFLGYSMFISNIGMLINRTARISTLLFLCCFTYFWILDKGYFNNHYYFISIICFLLFLIC